MTIDEFLVQVSQEGLEERLASLFDTNAEDYPATRDSYYQRLKFELDIIIQMGFPVISYRNDFIRWAKDNKIPVGPGRGSQVLW